MNNFVSLNKRGFLFVQKIELLFTCLLQYLSRHFFYFIFSLLPLQALLRFIQ
jgi:hypothetical protein